MGKSTLTRELTGVERAVGAVSRKAGTGRHTTSDPRLIPLPGGGAVVDMAGVRSFHLPRLSREELEAGFPEIAAASPDCRFRGCAHDGDAGCAVPGRVEPGAARELPPDAPRHALTGAAERRHDLVSPDLSP